MPIRVRINLPQDEITPLLDVLKAHKGEILNDPYSLIEGRGSDPV
jgi:hypothetical protein